MDFSQAFDMMPHGKLFIKMEKMGISTRAEKCVRICTEGEMPINCYWDRDF